MKYISFCALFLFFSVKSYSFYESQSSLPLDLIMEDIDNQQALDKENTIKTLYHKLEEGNHTASYILAFIYYTGSYGVEVDIDKAISLLSLPVEKGNLDAKHLLGTILITHEEINNARKGVSLLEESFKGGVIDSSINLYHAYKKGKYKNVDFLSSSLRVASDQGDYMATVFWGHVMLDISIVEENHKLINDAVFYLKEKFKSGKYTKEVKRDIYYLFVGIYGYPDSPLYDEFLRDFYMKRAAENGHPFAEEFVKKFLN
ncbi:tetratricopeptide repeat protein [Pseudoalteromonas sp. T1lg10]|uniref:tetratricopeptide repeat protein n=1 Tax=Pseudoalteromonas sp. T1lg10 TaxID=2077093 RepID=UPI000CF725CB|nr:hypothetical protein [Pseudoalteromonas sp. T1lg10]